MCERKKEKYNAWQCPLNARTNLYHRGGVIGWLLVSCFLLNISRSLKLKLNFLASVLNRSKLYQVHRRSVPGGFHNYRLKLGRRTWLYNDWLSYMVLLMLLWYVDVKACSNQLSLHFYALKHWGLIWRTWTSNSAAPAKAKPPIISICREHQFQTNIGVFHLDLTPQQCFV